ncbi:hypothetical protein C8R44DRAFT_836654 [Mycena epipterygia]|nr:hypothetical protein C8R44DRAFT_836654 [Mycena epipterygia]
MYNTVIKFQVYPSFIFTAFNILQCHEMLLHTGLKVKRPEFVQQVSEHVANGGSSTPKNEEERKVNGIASSVPGSFATRLMIKEGLPSFYITINPVDVYNPIVKFLAGDDIDIDALLPENVPSCCEQSVLIAKNPAIALRNMDIKFVGSLGYYTTEAIE